MFALIDFLFLPSCYSYASLRRATIDLGGKSRCDNCVWQIFAKQFQRNEIRRLNLKIFKYLWSI